MDAMELEQLEMTRRQADAAVRDGDSERGRVLLARLARLSRQMEAREVACEASSKETR